MLKLELQYFGHVRQRADSLGKTLMLGKLEGRRRRGPQRMAAELRCHFWDPQLALNSFSVRTTLSQGFGFLRVAA